MLLWVTALFFADISKAQDKPNILWITLEDTSPQFIGSYGNKHVKTPVMDELAARGVRFTNAFSTASVCSPSRSTIITGCSTEAMGTAHHRSYFPIPNFIDGFPSYLRKAGYYTTNCKKTDYNTSKERKIKKKSWNKCSKDAGWWGRKDGQPFFSVFNYMDCHQSRTMTWSMEKYEKTVLDNLSPKDITNDDEFEMPDFLLDSPEMRKQFARVYNSLNYTDIRIGKLLKRLEDDGLAENTIIFCYADHGEGIPKAKSNSIGLGYRVPFFVWFPKKYEHLNPWKNGTVTEELISFEDLAPSILSLAGVEIPSYMKGRPALGSKRQEPREYIFCSRNRCGESPDVVRSVTNGRYVYSRVFTPQYPSMKLHKYFDVADISKTMRKDYKDGKLNEGQAELFQKRPLEYLYDLKNDKWEMNNLALDPKYASILKDMRKAMFGRIKEVKDVHFLPEYELDQIAKKTTAYEYRQSKKLYPLKKVVKAASLVGQGKEVIAKQLKFLKHKNPVVRYWASVGLHVQGENMKDHKGLVLEAMKDSYPCVKIEMAALAWELFQDAAAKQILSEQLKGDNAYLAWQVLQSILYMEEAKAKAFLPNVNETMQIGKNKKSPLSASIVQGSIDLILHQFDGADLQY